MLIGTSSIGSSKLLGLFDPFNFDKEQARSALLLSNPIETEDLIKKVDLTGGIELLYNRDTGKVKVIINNDSLLLTKAALIHKVQLSYSHIAINTEHGDLYWGVKPTYFCVGLTNVDTRFGDLTDSELLFEQIKNVDYTKDTGFDVDLGRHHNRSATIIQQLSQHQSMTIEHNVQFEAGLYTDQRDWG